MSDPARVPVELDGELFHPLAPHGWPLDALVLMEDGDDGPFLAAILPPAEALPITDNLDDAELYDLADRLIAKLTTAI